MITSTTITTQTATSIEEMQQVARNQLQAKAQELEERAKWMRHIVEHVDDIRDWESYGKVIEFDDYDDTLDCDAVKELGEYYETMKTGNYF